MQYFQWFEWGSSSSRTLRTSQSLPSGDETLLSWIAKFVLSNITFLNIKTKETNLFLTLTPKRTLDFLTIGTRCQRNGRSRPQITTKCFIRPRPEVRPRNRLAQRLSIATLQRGLYFVYLNSKLAFPILFTFEVFLEFPNWKCWSLYPNVFFCFSNLIQNYK